MDSILIYYGLIILGMIIVIGAQINISSNYKKYKAIKLNKKNSGQEVARKILDANGLDNVYVVEVPGDLTDHYDPRRKVVKLSTDIFNGETIAAASVAAHEVGHAIQDKIGYSFMKFRSFLVPYVNFVSYLGYFGLLISLIGGIDSYFKISILVLCVVIVFQLITLPVEFDASKRAKNELLSLKLIDKKEHDGVGEMLGSAAMTYVAGLINNLLQFLRLVLIFGQRND